MARTLVIALAVALSIYLLAIVILALAGRRAFAREVAGFLPNLAKLFHGLIKDPRVPRGSKALLLFGVAWIASPIDLIPEFIPVLGPLDDAVVAALILRRVLRTAGEDVVSEHWRGDPATLQRLLRLFVLRPADPKEDPSHPGPGSGSGSIAGLTDRILGGARPRASLAVGGGAYSWSGERDPSSGRSDVVREAVP